jgi:hypothetical protein
MTTFLRHHQGRQRMEDLRRAGTTSGAGTIDRGVCDECGQTDVLTTSIDPESPISDTMRLCPSCARSPEPFWHDDDDR